MGGMGLSVEGCESNEVEIDSSTCLSGIIPYNDETCCTSTPAGCRWTGCFPGGSEADGKGCDTYHEIEAYKHDCEGLDGFLNNELCCAAPVNQCRWTNPQETCTSAETHVHNGGLLDALLDGTRSNAPCLPPNTPRSMEFRSPHTKLDFKS
eukprot:816417-Amphidinium_carterae.1